MFSIIIHFFTSDQYNQQASKELAPDFNCKCIHVNNLCLISQTEEHVVCCVIDFEKSIRSTVII